MKRKSRSTKAEHSPVVEDVKPSHGDVNLMMKDVSLAWLVDYAEEVQANYDEMMYVAQTHYDNAVGTSNRWPEYLIDGGKWEGQSVPEEFWDHFVIVKGLEPLTEDRPHFFSCSC